MTHRDHYRTLQVTRDAEQAVIERAYKALSMSYHPDRLPADKRPEATRRMQVINEAYSVIGDPARRKAYDAQLPPEGPFAWDRFWEEGLVGIFLEKFRR